MGSCTLRNCRLSGRAPPICEFSAFPQGAVLPAGAVGAEWEPSRSSGGCLQRKLGDGKECGPDSRA